MFDHLVTYYCHRASMCGDSLAEWRANVDAAYFYLVLMGAIK